MRRLILLLIAAPSLAAGPAARDYKAAYQGKLFSYAYGWPKEAAAIPALNRLLADQMAESRRTLEADATTAFADSRRRGGWFPEGGYDATIKWTLAGQTPRLLSLHGDHYTFSGGAHGLPASDSILWDKAGGTTIEVRGLFADPARLLMLRPTYCAALDAERAKRRDGVKIEMFSDCPAFSELTLVPVDRDRNGRFELLQVIADPYVAGPYVEGFYAVDLRLDPATLAAIRADYRSSFER